MARGWRTVARKAAGPTCYWLVLGMIVFVGMTLVIKIQATETRLVLVIVVFGAAFGAASLVEHLLRRGEPADGGGPRSDGVRPVRRYALQLRGAAATDGP
jgi:hypothetical protein